MKLSAHADDTLWAAIAEPSRRQLIDLLSEQGALSASTLAVSVPFSRQAVTKHLGVLEKAGIVSRRKQGKKVLFVLRKDKLLEASLVMREASIRWEQRLRHIKAIAEQLEHDAEGSEVH